MFRVLICFNIFIVTFSSKQYTCRDENNKAVDWYVIYKLPKIPEHENLMVREGKAYFYITSDTNNGWIFSHKSITDKKSIPALTLAPIYQESLKDKILYIMYNDQPPGTKDAFFNRGHAKGVVMAGGSGGFWLVHSVPHFGKSPMNPDTYFYPSNGFWNGQSFLCISLDSRNLELAAEGLMYNQVIVNSYAVPEGRLRRRYKKLAKVANNADVVKSPPWNKDVDIVSTGQTKFKVFAKSSSYGKELYSDFVAPSLGVNLMVQTWHGRSHQDSTCNLRYRVENILEVKLPGAEFPYGIDHSKWAVSMNKAKPWVCVGDINKDHSQKKRGGGTVCIQDKNLWKAFESSVFRREICIEG